MDVANVAVGGEHRQQAVRHVEYVAVDGLELSFEVVFLKRRGERAARREHYDHAAAALAAAGNRARFKIAIEL